jgi:transcriptional regulator with XRE-family HTH domain
MDEYPVRPSPIFRNPGKETIMVIGDRLRELRETKQLSQGDIEKRTGLLRCYISRVENGHTVPAIETLENWRELWKSRSISSSTKATNRPSCRIC